MGDLFVDFSCSLMIICSAVFYRLVDNDRCSSSLPEARRDEPCIPYLWSVFYISFFHVSIDEDSSIFCNSIYI